MSNNILKTDSNDKLKTDISVPEQNDQEKNKIEKQKSFYKKMKWDWCISGSQLLRQLLLEKLLPHTEGIEIDRDDFIDLLAWSLSLSIIDKKRVFSSWQTLSQFQRTELVKMFIDERAEFERVIDKEQPTITRLLFKNMIDWVIVIYGESKIADAVIIECLQPEIFGIQSLPLDIEFFPRNDLFFIELFCILLKIGAPKDLWQAAILQAKMKRKESDDYEFWYYMIEALEDSTCSIEHRRNILNAKVYIYENILKKENQDYKNKYQFLMWHANNLLSLKQKNEAKKYFSDAYYFSETYLSDAPEKKIAALKSILDIEAIHLRPEESEKIFDSDIFKKIDKNTFNSIYRSLSLELLFLGHGRLSFEIMIERIQLGKGIDDDDVFNISSISAYLGESKIADQFMEKFGKQRTIPSINKFIDEIKSEGFDMGSNFCMRCANEQFLVWMYYICSPSEEIKIALNKIYNSEYKKWIVDRSQYYSNILKLDMINLGQIFMDICNSTPINSGKLKESIKSTRNRLFILDNIYVASYFLMRRNDIAKVRQLIELANEIYMINEESLIYQNIPLTEKFKSFAQQRSDDVLLYAGHPDEVKKFEGTWTLERFKQLLQKSQ